MSAPAQELHVKQDDANVPPPQSSPEIVEDDADEVMRGFGFTETAVEGPKAKKERQMARALKSQQQTLRTKRLATQMLL